MKFLVFADSHGKVNRMVDAIEMHKNNTDGVIFLGDGVNDIEYLKEYYPTLAFYYVKGNCDMLCGSVLTEQIITIDGIKILITHSHLYGSANRYEKLAERAYERGASAVFFGHTHLPADDIIEINDKSIKIFNPGSVGYEGHYGILNTSGNVLVTSHTKIL